MKNKIETMKFRIKSAKHSTDIQRMLFSLGYKWAGSHNLTDVSYVDEDFLFVNEGGRIQHGKQYNFDEQTRYAERDMDYLRKQYEDKIRDSRYSEYLSKYEESYYVECNREAWNGDHYDHEYVLYLEQQLTSYEEALEDDNEM
jgi:hypothetical protein